MPDFDNIKQANDKKANDEKNNNKKILEMNMAKLAAQNTENPSIATAPADDTTVVLSNDLAAHIDKCTAAKNEIIKMYNKKFPETNVSKNDKPQVLTFPSSKDKMDFLKEAANKKKEFFLCDADYISLKPTGPIYFSFGDGKLHQFKVNPEEIKQLGQEFKNIINCDNAEAKAKLQEAFLAKASASQQALRESSSTAVPEAALKTSEADNLKQVDKEKNPMNSLKASLQQLKNGQNNPALPQHENQVKTARQATKMQLLPNAAQKSLLKLFQEHFPGSPVENADDNFPILHFNSQHDVDEFFSEAASLGEKFAAINVDSQGKPTGEIQFSLGDGKLHKGKIDPKEVDNFKAKLKELDKCKDFALQEELQKELVGMLKDDPKNKPTQNFKACLNILKASCPKDEAMAPKLPSNSH